MDTEQPLYATQRRASGLELRRYRPYVVAQTDVDAPMEQAGREGFRRLAGYIFGGNSSGQAIPMTAPVALSPLPEPDLAESEPLGRGFRIQFRMPSGLALASLPAPRDARVALAELPARQMAALAYRGDWAEERYRAHLEQLLSGLGALGLRAIGSPVWARFDPPHVPGFLRTNEILVEVAEC